MDIFITKNSFHTFANVVVIDLTHIDLVQRASTMIVHASIVAVQDKAQSYIERTLRDDLIPLAIKTYNCFHPHFDSFLNFCVHAYIAHHQ